MTVRVSAKRIEQINGARLTDAAGATIVRAAASAPHLWAYVHPDVKNALVMLEAQIAVLGGTRDDLLAAIEQWGIGHVRTSLELQLEDRRDWNIGRAAVAAERKAATGRARTVKRTKAEATLESWQREVDAGRLAGRPKHRLIASIADREGLSVEAVEKRLQRARRRARQK